MIYPLVTVIRAGVPVVTLRPQSLAKRDSHFISIPTMVGRSRTARDGCMRPRSYLDSIGIISQMRERRDIGTSVSTREVPHTRFRRRGLKPSLTKRFLYPGSLDRAAGSLALPVESYITLLGTHPLQSVHWKIVDPHYCL
jgi:hypothetical protein